MRAILLAHSEQGTDSPELYLLLAVIRRAHRDAVYKPGAGVKRPTITPEDKAGAVSFLRYLQQSYGRVELVR